MHKKNQTVLARIMEAVDVTNQKELADKLGIKQSSISAANKKNSIPPNWIVTLSLPPYSLNPAWIYTGEGPRYVIPVESLDTDLSRPLALTRALEITLENKEALLRNLASKELVEEIYRRELLKEVSGPSFSFIEELVEKKVREAVHGMAMAPSE